MSELLEQTDPTIQSDGILVNHVGFRPDSPKYCVVPRPPEKKFSIHRLKDCTWTCMLEGILEQGGPELEPGWVGEFTSLREEGIYQVRCGTTTSRCFVVWHRVYEVPMRLLYNYFAWQRCGDSTTGWVGPCHLDDGRIAETGEHRDLAGGYHQSGDLRKWASLEVVGLIGLSRFAGMQSPLWDDGCLAKELRWGGDYYQKLVREDGGVLDSVFIPLGWGPRDYYLSDAPPPAMWSTIRYQAMLAVYFTTRDASYAEKCRQTAGRVWRYMTLVRDQTEKYRAPAFPPRGHDNFDTRWYGNFYPGSAAELGHRLCAAVALYRATGEADVLEDAARSASALVKLQVDPISEGETMSCFWERPDGELVDATRSAAEHSSLQASPDFDGENIACFWEGPGREKLANGFFWHTAGPLGLCELLELKPEHPDSTKWRLAVQRLAEHYLRASRHNPWGLVPHQWSVQVRSAQSPHAPAVVAGECVSEMNVRENSNADNMGTPGRYAVYAYRNYGYIGKIAAIGAFLTRAAGITGRDEYRHVAQRQIDWIVGCNPYDRSSVEGVGYNQPQRGFFGEFFPPTPQIPGAIWTDINSQSIINQNSGFCHEYDMPIVGMALWLLTDLATPKRSKS
jgi:hypothetical protein